MRYAIVTGARTQHEAEAYLPGNYRLVHEVRNADDLGIPYPAFVIAGEDDSGWTLDDYVIPRYASGLIQAREIDYTHPVFEQITVVQLEAA